MSVVNVPGVEYPFTEATKLIIPPLALGALEQMLDRINAVMEGEFNMQGIGTVIDATHVALLRNYPDMTREDVANLVDLRNMREVLEAVMNASGMEAKAVSAEGEAAGEVLAPSSGANSTPI